MEIFLQKRSARFVLTNSSKKPIKKIRSYRKLRAFSKNAVFGVVDLLAMFSDEIGRIFGKLHRILKVRIQNGGNTSNLGKKFFFVITFFLTCPFVQPLLNL